VALKEGNSTAENTKDGVRLEILIRSLICDCFPVSWDQHGGDGWEHQLPIA
jgi:hypothetical protein